MNRASYRHTTGFDLPDRRRCRSHRPSQDDDGAPNMLLRRAAVGDDGLKLTAIASSD
jgi:hypothetical protein